MKKLDLGTEKIGKLLFAFSIPCIISMLINSVYNIVDQIFIGQGVGTIGNAATNVIFPVVIICTAIAGLIGNGCSANLSLRLGEGNKEEAKKSVGASIFLTIIAAILVTILGEIFLPTLIHLFGCTESVYSSALTYGRIILLGAPFMITYSSLSSIIRSDGSPKYSMICLVVGAIINLILDPIFIFTFNMGVAGGALATILGQAVSFVIAICYLFKMKSVDLKLKDIRWNDSASKTLGLGLSSFITQMTILALFVVMNNLMTKFGASSEFGADIPLSVYGVVSKVNSLYISSILGIAIGSQPIIGFNYGAANYKRVKETLRKVFLIAFIIGFFFNMLFLFFSQDVLKLFITKSDPNYDLFMKFAVDFCHIFLMVCSLNAFEMCTSISIQSLGNFKKATIVSFTRQIILFIPIAIILSNLLGLYGALYAGPIADTLCFFFVIFIFGSEYKKLTKKEKEGQVTLEEITPSKVSKNPVVITIAREYGSGGRYVGELLAKKLAIPCYDKELIHLTAKESGLSVNYIEENEQTKKDNNFYYSNDNQIFLAEEKVIKELSKSSCVIIGRCADYILKDQKNVWNIFLYTSDENKIKRAVEHYGLKKSTAKKEINAKNKEREKHYKFYTNQEWKDFSHYDLAVDVDSLGIDGTVEMLADMIKKEGRK